MKNFFLLLCGALLAGFTPPAHGALIAYEGFDYPNGSNLEDKAGGFGWDGPWDFLQFYSTNLSGSLSYTDAQGNKLVTTGNKLLNVGDAEGNNSSQPGRNLTNYFTATNTNRTIWISFLAQRIGQKNEANGATHFQRGANLSLFDTTSAEVAFPGAERLNIGESSSVTNDMWMLRAPTNAGNPGPAINAISTNAIDLLSLLVLRIDLLTNTVDVATNDNLFVWVNPALGAVPSTNSAATNLVGLKEFSFNRIRLFAGGNNGNPQAEWYLDELRVGDTYADVTPFVAGTGGQTPIKVSITRSGNQVEIGWPAGTLESAASILGPWSAVAGAAAPSYKLTSDGVQKYFRVRR
jgi:hypothetical protein